MKEQAFEIFLTNEPTITSARAVTSRLAKARKIESILGKDLDVIVSDDLSMYDALLTLQGFETSHNALQNALRKYYKFTHQREFPRLKNYKHP